MFCSGSQRSILDLANCGLRREPGAVRTSTSSTTPAWWSSAAKSVAGVVPWPTVTIRAKAFTTPLHHGLGVGAGYTAFLITPSWDLGPKIMSKFLISWIVTHVLGSRTGMVGRGETTALHPTACPSQIGGLLLTGTRLDRVLTRVLWCEGRFLVKR